MDAHYPVTIFYNMNETSVRFSYWNVGRLVSLDFERVHNDEKASTHLLMIENIPCDRPGYVAYDVIIDNHHDEQDVYWFRICEMRENSRLMRMTPDALAVDLRKISIVKRDLHQPLAMN